jgi:hypothetical protein
MKIRVAATTLYLLTVILEFWEDEGEDVSSYWMTLRK